MTKNGNYLTVEQAAEATEKSVRTIRRLCYEETSKHFISRDEKNRLLVDANFLAKHYPLISRKKAEKKGKNDSGHSIDTSTQVANANVHPPEETNLAVKVALLQQELKLKEELYLQVSREKDKRIEVLERTLLMLGEGQKKEPVLAAPAAVAPSPATDPTPVSPVTPFPEPTAEEPVITEQLEPEPAKKPWWKIF